MFCKRCGHKLSDDAIFCEKCGIKITRINMDGNVNNFEQQNNKPQNNVQQNKEQQDNINILKNNDQQDSINILKNDEQQDSINTLKNNEQQGNTDILKNNDQQDNIDILKNNEQQGNKLKNKYEERPIDSGNPLTESIYVVKEGISDFLWTLVKVVIVVSIVAVIYVGIRDGEVGEKNTKTDANTSGFISTDYEDDSDSYTESDDSEDADSDLDYPSKSEAEECLENAVNDSLEGYYENADRTQSTFDYSKFYKDDYGGWLGLGKVYVYDKFGGYIDICDFEVEVYYNSAGELLANIITLQN